MLANSGEPDQTPHSAASDVVLHCLRMSHKKDARLRWVQASFIFQISIKNDKSRNMRSQYLWHTLTSASSEGTGPENIKHFSC